MFAREFGAGLIKFRLCILSRLLVLRQLLLQPLHLFAAVAQGRIHLCRRGAQRDHALVVFWRKLGLQFLFVHPQLRDFGFGVGQLLGVGPLRAFKLLLLIGQFGFARLRVGLESGILRIAVGAELGLFGVQLAAYLVEFTLRLLIIFLLLLQLQFQLVDLRA